MHLHFFTHLHLAHTWLFSVCLFLPPPSAWRVGQSCAACAQTTDYSISLLLFSLSPIQTNTHRSEQTKATNKRQRERRSLRRPSCQPTGAIESHYSFDSSL
mmetsp:Transcript_52383/g.102529  ORF Transcript_52383/g.102529 Transcript_52383/m.102529 type:complete len:101 (-) Transcript_52383:287-589(-)